MKTKTKEATLKEGAEVNAILEGDTAMEDNLRVPPTADPQFLFGALTRSYYVLVEQTMVTQHSVIREYADSVQRHTQNVLQLWLGAWGSLSDVLVPLTAEEVLTPVSAVAAAAPALADGLARVKRSSKHDAQERRASAT